MKSQFSFLVNGEIDIQLSSWRFSGESVGEPSNVTQQFEGSFSKVSLHLTKHPLKLLLFEENFDPHLFSVCGHLVSAFLKNNPAKN